MCSSDLLERDPNKVLKDVSDGLISTETALRDYGVVITAGPAVDMKATEAARKARPAAASTEFSYGPERDDYEAAFTPEIQDALATALLAFPASQRQFYKSRVWQAVTDNGRAKSPRIKASDIAAALEQCRKDVTQVVI